jgi:hypothetical protein
MITPNAPIYIALLVGIVFTITSLFKSKSLPHLAEFMSVTLSAAAAYSAIVLCFEVLDGTKKLGDFQDQKLTIILGSVAVIWVALLTIIGLVQRIPISKGAATPTPSGAREENA